MIPIFAFTKSIRFWKLFLVAVFELLGSEGVIPADVAHAVALWLGGSVAVRTIDRASEPK